MNDLWLLLLPVAAASGWFTGFKYKPVNDQSAESLPSDYFIGLRYLINEQPDKAVDIFIKMLDVNSDTVETHLALGSLFRKRGEVNRAIRIHQNLIARPQLREEQRTNALFELAQDYMCAGVLDRAEQIFMELIQLNSEDTASYQYLLGIYEQQKDWDKAIQIAKKIESKMHTSMQTEIAHYNCELCLPQTSLRLDRNCVRASILLGDMYADDGNYKAAIRAYKKVRDQDPEYISEIIRPLAKCFEQLGDEQGFINYLHECLRKIPRISIILMLADFIRKRQSDFAAIEFIAEQISRYPSLRGLTYLTELYINNSDGKTKHKLLLLEEIMHNLLSNKPIYRCVYCGFSSKTIYWHCPSCKHWGVIKPIHGLEGD